MLDKRHYLFKGKAKDWQNRWIYGVIYADGAYYANQMPLTIGRIERAKIVLAGDGEND